MKNQASHKAGIIDAEAKAPSAWTTKLSKMRESLENSKQSFENMTGEILAVDVMNAWEVYGDQAKDPEREVIQCRIAVTGTQDTFKAAFTLPTSALSWRNPDFKLGKFVSKYGDLPEPGTVVTVELGRGGFYEIILD